MKPTKPGEWWWAQVDEGLTVVLTFEKRYPGIGLGVVGHHVPGEMDADDPRIVWLHEVSPPFAARADPAAPSSHDPAAPDASDEVRLAAGWSIEVVPVFEADELADNDASSDTSDKEQTPAPSPAGDWRPHVSGRLWVRWVVAS